MAVRPAPRRALSLRFRLAVLAAAALVPLAAVQAVNLQRQIALRLSEAETRAGQLARLAAEQYDALLDQARGVLETVLAFPEVRGGDPASCRAALRTVADVHAWTSSIFVADPLGRVVCGTADALPGVGVGDRAYFVEAVSARAPAVSDFVVGRVGGRPSVTVAVPALGPDGAVAAVAVAEVDADRLSRIAREMADDVPGSVVAVLDGAGAVVARHPRPESFVGRRFDETPMFRAVSAAPSGVYSGQALDGVERIVGFAAVGPHARLTLGIDRRRLLADAYRAFWAEFMATLAVLAGGAALVWWLADRLVLRGLADLEEAAAGVRAGETPRVSLRPGATPEIRRLAAAFGAMAEAVRAREEELRAARLAAEAGERAKAEFLSTMSHEIRTPLNGVVGFAQVLLDTRLSPEQREYVEMQTEAGLALLGLINDILDLSKIEAGKLALNEHPFEVARLVDRTRRMMEVEAARKGISLSVHVDPAAPAAVVGDPSRVQQILLNFLSNAVKFTDRGGVAVSVLPRPGGPGLRVEVEDTGAGIPAERQGELFRSFAQVHQTGGRHYGGTGLGLSICRQLAELMGGAVGVRSEPGIGSVFWFELPLPDAGTGHADGPAEDAGAAAPPPPGGRVLVVDDVEMNRALVRAMLTDAGWAVDLAEDGEAGVRMAAAGGYAAVLMDVRMPGIDGLEATRRIRALGGPAAAVPVVALSASVLPAEIALCREAGMDAHVPKPVEKRVLLRMLADVVRPAAEGARAARDRDDAEETARLRSLEEDLGRETLVRLLELMVSGIEKHAGAVRAAPRDRTVVGFAAHSLITLGGNMGFMRLSARARALQDACEDGEPPADLVAEVLAAADAAVAAARAEAGRAAAEAAT
jgi:signal transduction histidine kinase/CheY-like chemotaxis protein/HPt (histidine-containing phosphotransfer) domain-containing protein